MKNLFIVFVLLYIFSFNIIAQDTTELQSKISAYLELAGLGALYSINFDYRVNENISLRTGFTTFDIDIGIARGNIIGFPISVNYLIGEKHHGEFGIGNLFCIANGDYGLFIRKKVNNKFSSSTFANIGYRYQPNTNGMIFRATVYPGYIFYNNSKFKIVSFITIGLSIGYSF